MHLVEAVRHVRAAVHQLFDAPTSRSDLGFDAAQAFPSQETDARGAAKAPLVRRQSKTILIFWRPFFHTKNTPTSQSGFVV